MKKLYSLIIVSLLVTSTMNSQPQDSVKNGGFENETIGATTASNWYLPTDYAANMTTTIVDNDPHSGKNALKVVITNRESITGIETYTLQIVNENIMVEKNTPYRISIWSKGETLKESFSLTAGNKSYTEIGRLSDIKPAIDWTKYVFVALTGDNDVIRIPIHFLANGTYYFDDLSVVKSPMKSAVTNTVGDSIIVNFEWNIKFASTLSVNAFTVKVNGIASTIDSYNAKGSSGIGIKLKNKMKPNDDVNITYDNTQGDLTFTSGPNNAVGSFTDEIVENISDGLSSISSSENLFNIYPNPVENEINLKGINGTYMYSILNYSGQMIMSGTSSNSINAVNLKSGLYLIKVSIFNGNTSTSRFFKK